MQYLLENIGKLIDAGLKHEFPPSNNYYVMFINNFKTNKTIHLCEECELPIDIQKGLVDIRAG